MKIYESVTMGQVLERGAAQVPDKIAVVEGVNRKTYSELNSMGMALAASLSEIGLRKGDRAAIYMPNSIELMVAFYAMQKLGIIVAPNPVATPNPVLGESICACVIPRADQTVTLEEIRDIMKDQIAPHKLPDELCIMDDFPKLSGGVKIKKFGQGGLAELAEKDEKWEQIRNKV